MRTKYRRFAPLGLYLSLIAAIAALSLYIIQREWNLAMQISVGLVVIGLAIFAVLDPDKVRSALTGRQARYGSNALVLSIAFIGILAVVNYIVYQNPKRWDLTEDKQYTLAQETISTLETLPQQVQATAFFTADYPSDQAKTLLDQYKIQSNGKFDYRFIDPVQDPLAAQQANVTRNGSVLLTMGDRQQLVTSVTEQELTGGLVRLISTEENTVYFLTGHGEYSPEDTGDQSYSRLKQTLEDKNYTVKTLNLLADNQVPEDAKVIVVAGPRQPLSSGEVDLLKQFTQGGGSLIVMEEPTPVTDFGDQSDPLQAYLKDSWGISLGNDMVIDLSSSQASLVAVGSQFGTNKIVQDLAGYVTIMPTARSVDTGDAITGISPSVLVSTSQQAWAETDLQALQSQDAQVQPDQGTDILGPVPLAVAAQNLDTNDRIVVFGDADFATDAYFTAYGNGDLIVNSIDWATEQEELINLTPKDTTQRFLAPPQRLTMNLLLFGSVILLPGLILVSGVGVWFQRRRRG